MNTFTRLFLLLFLVSTRLTLLATPVTAQTGTATAPSVDGARVLNVPTLSVYPNPARGLVMVSVTQKIGQDYKLRLSNILGREVRTMALQTTPGAMAMPVNLSDLPSGMYFYSLLVNEKVVSTKRLVLQN